MNEDKYKQLFFSLIYSFQMQAMIQLGKLTNPVTNKTEKELEGAQITIDMLDMLSAKTKNNISDEESRFLNQVVADLKLNYVEERDKEKSSPSDAKNEEGSKLPEEGSKEKSSSQEKDNADEAKEKSSSLKDEDKDQVSTSETEEKSFTEQLKNADKPVPPQE